eukprot:jgi/Orpsp1_1/1177319/evm.model.c7180000060974.1
MKKRIMKRKIQKFKIQLFIEKEISGYYTNSQKELIACNYNSCSTKEKGEFKDLPIYFLNGNRLNDEENPIIVCGNKGAGDTNGCIVKNPLRENDCSSNCPEYPYKFNNLFINSEKWLSLIRCSINVNKTLSSYDFNYNCQSIDAKDDSYYLSSYSESSIENQKELLILCTNESSCKEFNNLNDLHGIFIDGIDDSSIISCDNENGCSKEKGYNYYIAGNYSEFNNILIDCCQGHCIKTIGINRGIYISGNGSELIKCDSIICDIIEEVSNDKIFLNGSNKKNTKPLIIYKEDKWVSEKGISGKLYINGNNKEEGNNAFIYCISDYSCTEISGDQDKKYIDVLSADLYIYQDGNFKAENNMISALGGNMKGFLINPNTFEVLEDNTITGKLIICRNDEDESLPECSTEVNYLYYIDGNNHQNLIKYNNNATSIMNSPIQGYYINTYNNIIACSGSECEIYSEYANCGENKIGSISNNMELCGYFDKNTQQEIKISISKTGKYMINISNGMFPGGLKGAYLLKFSENIIQPIFNDDNIFSYYLIDEDLTPISKTDTKGILYRCNGKQSCVIETSEGIYPNGDIDTIKKFQSIICNRNNGVLECHSNNGNISDNEVYCLTKNENNYLYKCEFNCNEVNDNNTPCQKQIANIGYYIPYYNSILIECTGQKSCKNNTNIVSGFYNGAELQRPLIQCIDSLNKKICNYVEPNNGFYLSNNPEKLLKCSDGTCKFVPVGEGYYISGENEKALIICKSQTES